MNPRELAFAAVVAASSYGCASSADTRPLTPAERAQLIREQEAQQAHQKTGLNAAERPGCSGSTATTRMQAREPGYRGVDSFDAHGCPELSSGGSKAPPPVRE